MIDNEIIDIGRIIANYQIIKIVQLDLLTFFVDVTQQASLVPKASAAAGTEERLLFAALQTDMGHQRSFVFIVSTASVASEDS